LARRADPLSDGDVGSVAKPDQIKTARVLVIVATFVGITIFELCWLRWVLIIPLPNAKNAGGVVTRSLFLWRALPFVVPGVRFEESYLGLAVAELSHVENLTQRVPIVLAASWIAAAGMALGSLMLRLVNVRGDFSLAERLPLTFGLGMSGLGVLTLVAGRLGWIAPWPVRIGLGGLIGIELACRVRRGTWKPTRPQAVRAGPLVGFVVIAGPFLVLMALGAMLPTIDFDALEYHLQGPKEYYQAGRISFLPHNVYTNMPFGVEMLHLLGMEVLGDWWTGSFAGQLLVMLHAPAAAAMIALATRQWASSTAAWFAAVIYLTTPWIYRLGVIPYVEGPLCYYHAALIWSVGRAWLFRSNWRHWGVIGALAGGAMACKYPALISAVAPVGGFALLAAWRQRSAWLVLAFGIGLAAVIGPWMLKNVIDTGNPVYPLGYRVFGGRDWTPDRERKWTAAHGPRGISRKDFVDSVLDVAGRSDWQSPLYAALAPLAFLRRGSRRYALIVAGYVLYLFGTWWILTHRLDRFWLPLLPGAAILAGLGADWTRERVWPVVLVPVLGLSLLTNLSYTTTALAGLNDWTGDYAKLRVEVPNFTNPPLAKLDGELPRDAKVLLVGQASVFHLRHPIVYNTVFNDEILETLVRGRTPEHVRSDLARLGVTHVYVDWFEIERYRSPGNYGFTTFVTREVFVELMRAEILDAPVAIGAKQELYRVRYPKR
jgi:hypothetical protein